MTNSFYPFSIQSAALNVNPFGSFGVPASDKSIPPVKLSLSQLTTLRWNVSEEVTQAKQTGYDAIGIWRRKLVEFGEQRAAEYLHRHRLSVSSLSFAGGFTGGCGFSYLEAIADCRQAIEQARILGARNVVVVGGSQNGHTVRHSRRLVVDALKELGDAAGVAQTRLSLLPMHRYFSKKWTFLNSLDHALEIINQIGHSHVGLAFDAYHLWQEPRLIERIPEVARLTGIVQLSDSLQAPQSDQDRLMPGEGVIPLTELIQAFQRAGYTGYYDVQVWSGQVWRSNYSHQIEQCHAAVKSMAIATTIST